MQETVKRFKEYLAKMHAYNHAMSALNYDSETAMPKKGAEDMAKTMGILAGESYKLSTSDEFCALLNELNGVSDKLDLITRREVEELYKEQQKLKRVPMDEYMAAQEIIAAAPTYWREAKTKNDFSIFKPYLEKIVGFMRKYAGYINPELAPYDSLLEEYEEGMRMATLDKFFADIRKKLVPVVAEVAAKRGEVDIARFREPFPIASQRKLSDYLLDVLTIDRDCLTLGEVEHPFTSGTSKFDVRLTTHYHEDDVLSNLFSIVHEGGHSLYELNIADELVGSPLGTGASMSIHESQSRFMENIIARSRAFTDLIHPKLCELFPEQMKGVTQYDLFRAANYSVPSLIRTEADELTYPMHIMVRYELEKRLIAGELAVSDLPEAWNAMYKEYLGVDVPTDREGVLQDSHWSGGMIGYFPSYALGSAYAAQMYAKMQETVDVDSAIRSGDLTPVTHWLTERIWKFGCVKKPCELILSACEAEFDPNYYTDYLTRKYKEIYGIK